MGCPVLRAHNQEEYDSGHGGCFPPYKSSALSEGEPYHIEADVVTSEVGSRVDDCSDCPRVMWSNKEEAGGPVVASRQLVWWRRGLISQGERKLY